MPVKDRIVTWFIKNIVVPRREIIDKPGFVVNTFSDKHQTTYLRELFLPESLFEIIEKNIVLQYGDQGKQALYSAGKKWGYLYSSMSNFPTIKTSSKEELLEFAYFLVRFVESTFAKHAEHQINLEEKTFDIILKDYVICRNNGLGYFMADGGIAGLWSYALQDVSIEGKQLECQGRGKTSCRVFCAPNEKINSISFDHFQEKNLPFFKFDKIYRQMNEIRQTTFAKKSLRNLLDAGFFTFVEGNLSYKSMRFFSCESHAIYILEKEITSLPDGKKILFEACFEYGKLLHSTYGYNDFANFITDFFPALGFGDIHIASSNQKNIGINYYPWTFFSDQSEFIIIRGILSGFISSCIGKNIYFNCYEKTIKNYLSLILKA